MSQNPVIKVGIVGFGRSGCCIHADAIAKMRDRFEVVAICDPLPDRRNHPEFPAARPYGDIDALLTDPEVELVVVAPPNYLHAQYAIRSLEAGKHVLCEKPFGFTTLDVDAMIAAAERANKILQPFQQRRYEEDFQKVLEVCRSGVLGRITFIRHSLCGFGRRWDWQTTRQFGGGQLYNNLPHHLDHAIALFGDAEPEVWCRFDNALSSGDAEDQVRMLLSGPDAPLIEIEFLATAALPVDRWFVCGTAGTLKGSLTEIEWKYVDWTKMPPRPLDIRPTEGRTYNREDLEWQTGSWKAAVVADAGAGAVPASKPVEKLYNGLYRSIREGKPQEITPREIRRRVAVMQKCYEINGVPFPAGTLVKEQ
ncbi:MAG: Gfo/Idh/MocA family protein [Victivallaceae bacterium]